MWKWTVLPRLHRERGFIPFNAVGLIPPALYRSLLREVSNGKESRCTHVLILTWKFSWVVFSGVVILAYRRRAPKLSNKVLVWVSSLISGFPYSTEAWSGRRAGLEWGSVVAIGEGVMHTNNEKLIQSPPYREHNRRYGTQNNKVQAVQYNAAQHGAAQQTAYKTCCYSTVQRVQEGTYFLTKNKTKKHWNRSRKSKIKRALVDWPAGLKHNKPAFYLLKP